jgi:hypothetical protein
MLDICVNTGLLRVNTNLDGKIDCPEEHVQKKCRRKGGCLPFNRD